MKIDKLFHQAEAGTSGLEENTIINIDIPVTIDGRIAYRQTYYLRFTFDEYANGLRLKPGPSQLSGRFESYYLHLTTDNETFQTQGWQSEESDNLVKVHLTHPWRLTKVKTYAARGIDVLRLDGDAISEEPTIKANANTTIGAEFTGQDLALRKMPVYAVSELSAATDMGSQAISKQASENKQVSKNKKVMRISAEPGGAISTDDMAVDEFGADVGIETIPAHGIQWIQLKSYPTGPRIRVGEVNTAISADSQLTNLWNKPGQHTNNPVLLTQDSKEAIMQQLQTALDRFIENAKNAGTPISSLYIPVTIESDTPAKFKFTHLDIHYSLLKSQWDHWTDEQKQAGKETIRFDGSTLHKQGLQLNFPPLAQIEKALIHMGTDIGESSGFAAGALNANLDQTKGIQLNQGTTVAKLVKLDQARQVNKAAIAIMPVSDMANLTIELREDQNGKANGAVLAQNRVQVTQTNSRHWIFITLNQSVLLDTGTYWLCVSAMDGTAVWLANNEPGKGSVETEGRVNTINDIKLLGELGQSLPVSNEQPPENLSLQLGNDLQTLAGDEVDISSSFSSAIPDSIQLVSGESGAITLYSPEFEYSQG